VKAIYILIAACAAIIVVTGILIARNYWSSPIERANFIIAAWSAAFGTLIFGLVVGYSIYAVQHSQESTERIESNAKQASENRLRILSWTRVELTYDRDALKARGTDSNQALLQIHARPLKNEFWQMLSRSGDLRSISNYDLLYKLADAYFYVERSMYWEQQFLTAITGTGMAMSVNMSDGTSKSLAQYIWTLTSPTYSDAQRAITAGLLAIDDGAAKNN
jgi:hypothetical protein